jgi:hypothetical protein
LFAKDEIDEICSDLVPALKKEHPKLASTNENLYEFFLTRTRKNLHIVLCFSPVRSIFSFCLERSILTINLDFWNRLAKSSGIER